ncbi:hypothetical protein SLS57_000877 [Botryosphaeria dothidea]
MLATLILQIPQKPSPEIQSVDSTLFCYSIELSYLVDYAGNLSHPNTLSHRLLSNIQSITNTPPPIRVGGTTQNHATYLPNQTSALIQYFSTPGADQPDSLTISSAFFESFKTFPDGTKYIYGLNFFDGDAGKAQALLEAHIFPVNRTNSTWSLEIYVAQWLDYTSAISTNLSSSDPLFQAGVFTTASPGLQQLGSTPWTAETALTNGIASTGQAKTFAEHAYMGAACAGSPTPSLDQNLLNHTYLAHHLQYFATQSAASVARGLPYVIGETNSIACQGLAGVSDVFGAALWAVDYAMYAAAKTNVSRLYFHGGTGYRYAAWQPVDVVSANGSVSVEKGVRPLYYGHLVVARVLAGGEKKVVQLVGEERFVAYGVYRAGGGDGGEMEALRHVVLLNLGGGAENSTMEALGRTVKLPEVVGQRDLRVRRLTGLAVDSAEGIEWAGQTVDEMGRIVGKEKVERVSDGGTVVVKSGEAVLVSF